MKKGIFKIITMIFAGLIFTSALSSCGNKEKYLDGGICGKATAEGTNAFSEIRRYYVEQFVYEANAGYVAEGGEYAEYKELYDSKFALNESSELNVVEYSAETATEYLQAHHLFYYYDLDNETLLNSVKSYLAANAADSTKAEAMVKKVAYGTEANSMNSYFIKRNNTSLDANTATVGSATIQAVSTRMTSHSKACIVFDNSINDPNTGVTLPVTTWKYAWDNAGFFFCIFVYPIAWVCNVFVKLFNGANSGWGQIAAIFVVTILLKLLVLAITFKSQASTQKMQDAQPEIAAIQAKYGGQPQTAQDKQRMSQEMMAVYQKYNIKPLAPFLSLLITFPLFIAMYRAISFLAVLRTGSIGGVILGNNINTYIIGNFHVVALLIFLLMAATQIVSMKLPQIMNRKRLTEEARKSQGQANMMSNVMMIMILVMGFFMPVLMDIYWIASAIVSTVQALIMHKLNNKSGKKGQFKLKKAERERATIPQGYRTN